MRHTTTKTKRPMTWAEIERRVLTAFSEDRVGVAWAIEQFRKESQKVRQAEEDAKVVHRLQSPPVIAAAVRVLQADIRHKVAVFRARAARDKHCVALVQLRATLGAHDGVFPDEEDGEHIVPELLEARRTTKAAKMKKLQKIIDASKRLASAEGADSGETPAVPKGLSDGVHKFMSDLQEFLRASGDEGRELVLRICDDPDYARKLVQEEGLPPALQFLAQIVAQATANTRLPASDKKSGFGFGRR